MKAWKVEGMGKQAYYLDEDFAQKLMEKIKPEYRQAVKIVSVDLQIIAPDGYRANVVRVTNTPDGNKVEWEKETNGRWNPFYDIDFPNTLQKLVKAGYAKEC